MAPYEMLLLTQDSFGTRWRTTKAATPEIGIEDGEAMENFLLAFNEMFNETTHDQRHFLYMRPLHPDD